MKEIWNRRERLEKEKNCILMFVIRNPKARRTNKTFYVFKKIAADKTNKSVAKREDNEIEIITTLYAMPSMIAEQSELVELWTKKTIKVKRQVQQRTNL
jgi:hypothetical protein